MPHVCGDEPTSAGFREIPMVRMPHVCGDEPFGTGQAVIVPYVCPTHVGMNRPWHRRLLQPSGMPHACGDEPPTTGGASMPTTYAPRRWG